MREFMNIVENAQPFMFHATRAENLDSIRAQGLVPNGKEPNWDGYPVNGRLYVSRSESGAQWYAEQLADMYEEQTIVLRFRPCSSGRVWERHGGLFHHAADHGKRDRDQARR